MQRWIVALAGLLACGLPGMVRADDEASALLAKHYAYVGWQFGDGRVPSLKIKKHQEVVGSKHHESDTVELHLGVINRISTTDVETGLTTDTGFTGNVFWNSDENGFTSPERGDGIKYRVATQTLFGEGTQMPNATVRRHDTVGGVPVVVVREDVMYAFPIDLYVDPQTGAYVRAVFDPDGDSETIDVDGYQTFADGKRTIGEYHYDGSKFRHVVDSIEAGIAISNDELHPPAPRAKWTFGLGGAIPIELRPADYGNERVGSEALRVYVNAFVNGVPGRFVLDSGASSIAITDEFARKAKVKKLGDSSFVGIAGSASSKVQRADTMSFADGSVLSDVVIDSGISNGDEHMDGLLGYDFLAGAIVRLDLDKKTIHLEDASIPAPVPADAYVLLPDLSDGTPVLPATFAGTKKGRVLLDSGNPYYTLLSDTYVSRLKVLVDDQSFDSTHGFGGVSGGVEVDRCATLSSLQIGLITYQSAPACFSPSVDKDEGIVGLDFLKNFNITYDYPEGKMLFFVRK